MTLPSACSYTFSKSGGNAASLAHCKRNATRYHVEMNYPQAQDLTSSSGSKIYLIPYNCSYLIGVIKVKVFHDEA
eukprot:scaffold3119_cov123-Skeletonema_marinoi.AAC.7